MSSIGKFGSRANIGTQTILAAGLASIVACSGGSYTAPAPLAAIQLADAGSLKPFDPTDPGLPKPEGMALTADGKAWVTLSNLDLNYSVAGPAMLASVVPSTGVVTLLDLAAGAEADGGVDDRACLNAGVVKNDNGYLLAACSGGFDPTDTRGRAVVEVDPNGVAVLHTLAAPAGLAPYAIAGASSKIWVGDANTASLYSIDRATFTVADGADASHPAIALPCSDTADHSFFVTDLLVSGSTLYALCSADPDGYIVQLDATSGAVQGSPQLVGSLPIGMAELSNGEIAVINSDDETVALVTPGASGPTVQKAVYTFPGSAELQDVQARGMYLYVTASGANVVARLDLSQTDPAKMLAGEANTGDDSYPWSVLPLDDNQALVSLNGLNDLVGVNFATADAGTQ